MHKVLVRGGTIPSTAIDVDAAMLHDPTGTNTGNLLYANGVYRVLAASGYEMDFDGYAGELDRYGDDEVARINEGYDAYVIPLADAFRPDFRLQLRNLARLVRRLRIPCIVVGVGLRAPFEPGLGTPREFDDDARSFVEAVLERSATMGTRGGITVDYLHGLGVSEEALVPIGCPSMYTFGTDLHTRELALGDDPHLVIGHSQFGSRVVRDALLDLARTYRNTTLVVQQFDALRRVYLGMPDPTGATAPVDFLYDEGRVRAFLSAQAWIDYLRIADLCVSGRLHGAVAGLLGGAPTMLIASDTRMRELAELHAIPGMPDHEVKAHATLEDLLARVDLGAHLRVKDDNFARYTAFLRSNGLQIPDDQVLDKRLRQTEGPLDTAHMLSGIASATAPEVFRRLSAYQQATSAQASAQVAQLQGLLRSSEQALARERETLRQSQRTRAQLEDELRLARATIGELRGTNAQLAERLQAREQQLNRKAAQAALKAADAYGKARDFVRSRVPFG